MPLLAINLSDKLFFQIKELVERGLYQSFESFVEIAAFNQLALERGASPAEIVEKGHRKVRQDKEVGTDNGNTKTTKMKEDAAAERPTKAGRSSTPRRAVEPVARLVPADEPAVSEADFDAAFNRLALLPRSEASPKPLSAAADKLSNEHVFGQVNRFLPLKLACRWLATASAADGRWSKYDSLSDRLADDAATIGSLLEKWDEETERKREDQLATGLPRRGNSASRDRFLTQFLARVTRGGDIYPGVICQYQLARFEESMLVLTDQGLAFAALENPILDKRDSKAAATLAPAESEFLANQILEWAPAERDDMRVVLQAVIGGKATPSQLTGAVRPKFPADWSDSVFQTHLSGLIARLGEIRFLRRSWQGRNVNYQLVDQPQAESFLKVTERGTPST
jgi:hypothetical protein